MGFIHPILVIEGERRRLTRCQAPYSLFTFPIRKPIELCRLVAVESPRVQDAAEERRWGVSFSGESTRHGGGLEC